MDPTPTPGIADTGELLRRHAAGEKLTPREYGLVGRHYQRTGTRPPGRPPKSGPPRRPGPPASLAPAGPTPGDAPANPLLDGLRLDSCQVGPVQGLGPAPGTTVCSPEAIRATTGAALRALDRLTQSWLRVQTLKAGGDAATAERWAEKAAMSPGDRDLIIETSGEALPPLFESIGLDPKHVPLIGFAGGLAGYGIGVAGAHSAMQEEAAERLAESRRPKASP